jgi:hypothetical protein
MSLIALIVVLIVAALLIYFVRLLPIEQPFKNIIIILVVIVLILWLLSASGVLPGLRIK